MLKKILKIFIVFIITSILFSILGYINLIRIKKNNSNILLSDNLIESQLKFFVNYEVFEIYQEIDRYNRIINLFKKVEKEDEIIPIKSDIKADIKLKSIRNKLKYFSTYAVQYKSIYLIYPEQENIKKIKFIYKVPSKKTVFDDFKITINNKELKEIKINKNSNEIINDIQFKQGEINKIEISYVAKGVDFWKYSFGEKINQVIDFNLELTTNFKNIIFPEDCIPTPIITKLDDSYRLCWNYKNLLFGYNLGIKMPNKINPGQIASQISFFGILSLLLFFIFLYFSLIYNNKEFQIIDYCFLALSFFIFLLIFSFTIQYFNIYISLIFASVISLSISGLYIFMIVGTKFTLLYILIPQFIYLVILSFSHFFDGVTGITLTIIIIITIVILMIISVKSIKIRQQML